MPDKAKRMSKEDIISRLREDIKASEEVRDIESVQNAKAYEYYRAKKMGNEVEGRSKIVSSDVFETVEWMLPALMDIFSNENGLPEFEPVGPEDVAAAEAMTELIRYQFWRANDGETIMRQAIKDCLMYRPGGIIKYAWEKVATKVSYQGLAPDEVDYLIGAKSVDVLGVTPEIDEIGNVVGYNVEGEKDVEYDGPKLYLLPQNEFLRHPNAKTVDDAPFVAHKKKCTADYLRRLGKVGYYENVEKAIEENSGGGDATDYAEDVRYSADDLSKDEEPSGDPARKMFDLYESYIQIDENGDGILESRIIVTVGDVILRDVENPYGRPPFVVLRPIEDTHKFSGINPGEMVEDLQRLNTFLLRQTVDNIAQSNNSRKVVDPTKVNMADVTANIPGYPIRTKNSVRPADAIMELPTQPVNASVMQFFGISKEMGEMRTGISKALKSVGDTSNQTATGQLSAINQASVRIRLTAKIIGSSMAQLFRAMVLMNKKFLTRTVAIRLNEKKFLQISPDDLEGKMDLVLNVVLGSQSRQQTIINMQQLLAVLGQLAPIMPGVLDAGNVKSIITEIVKAMGYKNQDRFLPSIFLQDTDTGNAGLEQKQLMQSMMEGGMGAGTGGQTMGSIANTNMGAMATTNPAGAGGGGAAWQNGSGGIVNGLPA